MEEGEEYKIMLPDGSMIETNNKDEVNAIVSRFEEQGYDIIRQGDYIIITSTPKQAIETE